MKQALWSHGLLAKIAGRGDALVAASQGGCGVSLRLGKRVEEPWFQHFRIETAKKLLRAEPNTERESLAYGIRDGLYGTSNSTVCLS